MLIPSGVKWIHGNESQDVGNEMESNSEHVPVHRAYKGESNQTLFQTSFF